VEIILEKNFLARQPDFNDFDAVFTVVTRLDKITKLQYKDFDYMINDRNPIEVAPGIQFQLTEINEKDKTGEIYRIVIRLWTDTLGIRDLKDYIGTCRRDYESLKNNKLGGEKYYFDQTTSNDSKLANVLVFDKKKYTTNRRFENVFFEEKEEVENRVRHFRTNKSWYDKRGIPHTMGFMFSGGPGVGKTSTIKAISFECDCEAIINVRLSKDLTNTQMNNLFYSPVLHIKNPETLSVEKVVVPIHKRLYVVEDIDSMTDLVMKRELQFEERKKAVKAQRARPKPEVDFSNLNIDDYLQDAVGEEKIDMEREKLEDEEHSKPDMLNLASLLNILDGTLENPGRIIVFTTNHPEVIDPALIRPGRVDMNIHFKLANRQIIKQMFESFYDQKFGVDDFKKIKEYHVSPAVINQIMFRHFSNPVAAIADMVVESNRRKTYKPRKKKGKEEVKRESDDSESDDDTSEDEKKTVTKKVSGKEK
jgi:hypothetical protein